MDENSQEVFSLPRGFHDQSGIDVELSWDIVNKLFSRGASIGCEQLETSPVGFSSTFRRARFDPLENTYSLRDRGNRDLMLAPDSIPGVMRWFLSTESGSPRRVSFVSPIFRYRRQQNRFFRQIGFACINEPDYKDDLHDENSLLIAKTAIKFMREDVGVPITVQVTDFSVWHRAIEEEIMNDEQKNRLFYTLSLIKDTEGKINFVREFIRSNRSKDRLIELLQMASCGNGELPSSITERASLFVKDMDLDRDIPCHIRIGDLHGVEMQRGIAYSFFDEQGRRCGDGGCYSHYASKFHRKIYSMKSFASGIEYLIRRSKQNDSVQGRFGVMVLCIGAPLHFIRAVEATFLDNDIKTIRRSVTGKLSTAINKYKLQAEWVLVLGPDEFVRQNLRIASWRSGAEFRVEFEALGNWISQNYKLLV